MCCLTWHPCGEGALEDGDLLLRVLGPVHHAPPAFHGEADVGRCIGGESVKAEDLGKDAIIINKANLKGQAQHSHSHGETSWGESEEKRLARP